MHNYLLLKKYEMMPPEMKLFLIQLVKIFKGDECIDLKVTSLARRCGVTSKVVVNSLRSFVERGILDKGQYQESRIGRPVCVYNFGSGFKEELAELSKNNIRISSYTVKVIDYLLSGDGYTLKLRSSLRLLLCVLIVKSTRYGVVEGLGGKEIFDLTGISEDRLRSMVSKLTDLGLISYHISGITNSFLLGRRSAVYFLDMAKIIRIESNRPKNTIHVTSDTLYDLSFLCKSNNILLTKADIKNKKKQHDDFHFNLNFNSSADILMKLDGVFSRYKFKDSERSYFQYEMEKCLLKVKNEVDASSKGYDDNYEYELFYDFPLDALEDDKDTVKLFVNTYISHAFGNEIFPKGMNVKYDCIFYKMNSENNRKIKLIIPAIADDVIPE